MSRGLFTARIKQALGTFTLDVQIEAVAGVTAIIGASGAGKTSALRAIAGLITPEEGHIAYGDIVYFDTTAGTNMPMELRRFGYVFQDALLFPHMRVIDNLDYGSKRHGGLDETHRKALIDLLALEPLLNRYPRHLSGGEAQRVAIARALLSKPQLLLLDEPMASLDPARRREIMPYLEAMTKTLRLPVILVSHNIDEVARLADRVIVFDRGRVFAQGEVSDVLNRLDVQQLIHGESGEPDIGTIIDTQIASHNEDEHLTEVTFPGGTLTIGHMNAAMGEPVRLRLRARDIAVATQKPTSLSIQNMLKGRIEKMENASKGQMTISIRLDGDPETALLLQSIITQRAAKALSLANGQTVWALIKSVSIVN